MGNKTNGKRNYNKKLSLFLIASSFVLSAASFAQTTTVVGEDYIIQNKSGTGYTSRFQLKDSWIHNYVKFKKRNYTDDELKDPKIAGKGIVNKIRDDKDKLIAETRMSSRGYEGLVAEDKRYSIISDKNARTRYDKDGITSIAEKGKAINNRISTGKKDSSGREILGAGSTIREKGTEFHKDVNVGETYIRDTKNKKNELIIGDKYSKADGEKASSLGNKNTVEGKDSTGVGSTNVVKGDNSSALGNKNTVEGKDSTGVGSTNVVKGENSAAFGYKNIVNKANSIGLGQENVLNGENSSALGKSNNITGDNSSALGQNNTVLGNSSAAIGNNNNVGGDNNFAFGNGITFKNGATNSVGLGNGSTVTESNVVSVGSQGKERRITNVAEGINDTDGVNVKQLKDSINVNNQFLNAGIAQSMAMANIPQVGANKLFSIGFGAAYFNKQGGFALGISGTEKTNTFIYKIAAGIDTKKQFSVGAGFNINFGANKSVALKDLVNAPLASNSDIKAIKDALDKLQAENKELRNEVDALRNVNTKEKLYIIDQFINDKFKLTSTQMTKLQAIVNEINEKYSDRIIDITGHTDTNHNEKYNLSLGLRRANMIADLMIKLGLKNPQNIRKVSSYGFNNMVNGGLSTNRRVEITVK